MRVVLRPGEQVTAGGVVLPTNAGIDTNELEELNHNLRLTYQELKRMGVRNAEQQKQFEQMRSDHPSWDKDEEESPKPPQTP